MVVVLLVGTAFALKLADLVRGCKGVGNVLAPLPRLGSLGGAQVLDDKDEPDDVTTEKSSYVIELIKTAVRRNFLFRHLGEEELDQVVGRISCSL